MDARSVAFGVRTLTVRTATQADAEAVHPFYVSSYGETEFLSRYRDEISDKSPVLQKTLQGLAESAKGLFLVALDGRLYQRCGFEVEGCLRARRKHGDAFVDALVMAKLHPSIRRFREE